MITIKKALSMGIMVFLLIENQTECMFSGLFNKLSSLTGYKFTKSNPILENTSINEIALKSNPVNDPISESKPILGKLSINLDKKKKPINSGLFICHDQIASNSWIPKTLHDLFTIIKNNGNYEKTCIDKTDNKDDFPSFSENIYDSNNKDFLLFRNKTQTFVNDFMKSNKKEKQESEKDYFKRLAKILLADYKDLFYSFTAENEIKSLIVEQNNLQLIIDAIGFEAEMHTIKPNAIILYRAENDFFSFDPKKVQHINACDFNNTWLKGLCNYPNSLSFGESLLSSFLFGDTACPYAVHVKHKYEQKQNANIVAYTIDKGIYNKFFWHPIIDNSARVLVEGEFIHPRSRIFVWELQQKARGICNNEPFYPSHPQWYDFPNAYKYPPLLVDVCHNDTEIIEKNVQLRSILINNATGLTENVRGPILEAQAILRSAS